MRRLINAARQPRDDYKPASPRSRGSWPEISARRRKRCASRRWRSSAASRRPSRRAREQRRRVLEPRQPRRVAGFARRGQSDVKLFACGKFGAHIFLAAEAAGARRASAPRQLRQPLQRGPRAADMTRKRAEGQRPDIVGPDQPQPFDPLDVGQLDGCVDGVDAGLSREASMAQPEGGGGPQSRYS